MLHLQGLMNATASTYGLKNAGPFRPVLTAICPVLALLVLVNTGFSGEIVKATKVGDTVDVQSGTMLLHEATVIGLTSNNMTVMAGLDYYMLPLAGSVVTPAPSNVNSTVREGDWVDVKSEPQILLKHALLTRMTSSNITVATSFETIDLPLSNTVIRLAEAPPQEQVRRSTPLVLSNHLALANSVSPNADAAALTAGDPIVQQILGKYASDAHYNDSLSYYTSMMSGLQSGSVQLDDLVREAEQVLGTLDQYEPERAKDPEFEGNISTLRDFVNRAKAGEKIETVR